MGSSDISSHAIWPWAIQDAMVRCENRKVSRLPGKRDNSAQFPFSPMPSDFPILPLVQLPLQPYLDRQGVISQEWQGKIGAYAIFNGIQALQYVGYSRDIYLSLRQHLVRQPESCHSLKVQLSDRPSRTLLEAICQRWIAENGTLPPGNGDRAAQWIQAIDVRSAMTEVERASFQSAGDLEQAKLLKSVARRVEAEIQARLQALGIREDLRFNPKLKEQGLLDLK